MTHSFPTRRSSDLPAGPYQDTSRPRYTAPRGAALGLNGEACNDLHPEHAVTRFLDRRIERRRDRHAERVAGIDRIDDAVVPDFRRAPVLALLALELAEYRIADRVDIGLGEFLAFLCELAGFDIDERVRWE